MPHILLLGAGFSRNWHGWLASEIGSDLAGRLASDAHSSGVLQQSKGFEDALSTVQVAFKANPNDQTRAQLRRFQDALQATFAAMNDAFAAMADFEFTQDYAYQVVPFLTKFDAIFTLNQDLLLELHYRERMVIPSHPRWSGCEFPGMIPQPPGAGLFDARAVTWRPAPQFAPSSNLQPIFKLHGSTNWRDADGGELLVMGADKAATIQEKAILRRYADEFLRYLSMPGARLMVIGYGFLDPHINDAIVAGSRGGGLKMFIVDHPAGWKVLRNINPTSARPAYLPQPIEQVGSLGDSTRSLRDTFGTDRLEHGKLCRFFSP